MTHLLCITCDWHGVHKPEACPKCGKPTIRRLTDYPHTHHIVREAKARILAGTIDHGEPQ